MAAWTGWDLWHRGFGSQDFLESDFANGFDRSSASGMWANHQIAEARGLSYVVSQIALAGPLQLLKAYDLIRSRIVAERGLETNLETTLQSIESKRGWQPIANYRGKESEVMYLIRLGKLEFSPRKGVIKAKSQ
ncbi:MAG: hypothetical protein KDN19_16960 [Verrucomicrobiae bacterium]|nr:hypothetical protein [Verrucomicrobiae bacterium]